MSETQAAARLQERIEALCGASIRALTGDASVRFRGSRLHRGGERLPLFAPHLHPSPESDDFASFRGAADGLALRLALSDAGLHETLAPGDPVERLIFGWLEQFRVESLAPERLAGVAHNLRHRHLAWSMAYHEAGHTDSARGLLLYTVAQVARARVSAQPVVEATEDRIEATRFALAPRIGNALAGLRRARHDQAGYAVHARSIAAVVATLLREQAPDRGEAEGGDDAAAGRDAVRSVFGLLVEEEEGAASERSASAVSARGRVIDAAPIPYRVFTTAYDREDDASARVRAEVLSAYRARLDERIAAQHLHVSRLARQLLARLTGPSANGWDSAQEEGRIDGRALARLVASPLERRLFRRERAEPLADAAVSFLIDCSGSMKARAADVALLVDGFARALDLAGAASEILGFTTAAWNGGQARRDWLRAGRPPFPGRLNERLHLRFKTFETPWRQARSGIAALYHGELFREGLDGEAVEWAATRLLGREESRKILFVVSDGSPMDGATHVANSRQILDRHLLEVVERIERSGAVEIHGLGVGLDLSAWYRSSHVLDLDANAGRAMFGEVLTLIGNRRDRR